MRYRIEVQIPRDNEADLNAEERAKKIYVGPAAILELAEYMDEIGLPAPRRKITNARIRFFFTEEGWKRFGKLLQAQARGLGYALRVTGKRNIGKGNVIFRDRFQIAVLPIGRRSDRTGGYRKLQSRGLYGNRRDDFSEEY